MAHFLRRPIAIGTAALAVTCALATGQPGAAATKHTEVTPWTRYVALGDSFVASPLTGMPVGLPSGCGRTQNNYPRQVAAVLKPSVFVDRSCGGASTDDFFHPQDVLGGPNMPQLDGVTPDTTLVTIGVGGNDVLLFGILQSCAHVDMAQSDCADQIMPGDDDPLIRRIARLAPKLDNVLAAIHQRAPRARVLVVGYPAVLPVSGTGCFPQLPLSDTEVAYFRDIQQRLNHLLENITKSRGDTFVDTYTTSIDHDPCQIDGIKWVEGLSPDSPAASLHPNLRGQQGLASDVLAALGYLPQ